VRGEPGAQVFGAGHDQGPGLVDGLGPLGAGAVADPALRPPAGPSPMPCPASGSPPKTLIWMPPSPDWTPFDPETRTFTVRECRSRPAA
jgi:hypothetical protein